MHRCRKCRAFRLLGCLSCTLLFWVPLNSAADRRMAPLHISLVLSQRNDFRSRSFLFPLYSGRILIFPLFIFFFCCCCFVFYEESINGIKYLEQSDLCYCRVMRENLAIGLRLVAFSLLPMETVKMMLDPLLIGASPCHVALKKKIEARK